MNYKKILIKTFFVLSLVFTLSTHIYASEIVGNISSSTIQGTGEENNSESEINGTLGNGIILAGNVSGGSGSSSGSSSSSGGGSGTSGNQGFVLGESTAQTNQLDSVFSSDGSLKPSAGSLVLGTTTTTVSETTYENTLDVETAEAASPFQTDVTTDESSGINWLWIILALLLLVTVAVYLYSYNEKKPNTK